MADQDRCRGCGKKRPTDAPGGLCPACLLRAGQTGDDSAGSAAVLTAGLTTGSGVLATLSATLGAVPRMLLRDTEPVTGPGPMVRPGSPEMPGRAPIAAPGCNCSARSPAAAWGRSSRGETPTSAATWPSRSCSSSTATTPS